MKRTVQKTVGILLIILLIASFIAILRILPTYSAPVIISNNLLVNPGFESGLTGWSTSQGTAVYSIDNMTLYSGFFSCRGVETGIGSLGRLYQDVTNITSSGNQYQISGWIKTSGVNGSVVIGLDYVDADGWTPEDGYVYEIGYVSGTQDWTFFQSDWLILPPMPSDAQALWFLFDFNNGAGTAWFDDVSLTVSGITIANEVVGVPPSSPWNYIIVNADTNEVIKNFTLPAGGGSITFSDSVFTDGGSFLLTATPKFGYYLDISAEIYSESSWAEIVNSTTIFLDLAPDDFIGVTFTNTPMPAFTVQSLGSPPPSDLNFNIPPLKPTPVQAGWSVDVNPPSNIDLVLGKPLAILVNVSETEHTILPNYQITVSVSFEGNTYINVTTGSQILTDSIVSIWNQPIVPPRATVANESIIGSYTIYNPQTSSTIEYKPLTRTDVTVKDTTGLSLYYCYMTKTQYGTESEAAYNLMVGNSTVFINATYPVKNVTADVTYANKGITGAKAGSAGMQKDAVNVATKAKLMGTSAVGIAIGPNSTAQDYFSYHGYPSAAGVSFGPSVKGVIVLDGYYTAASHEVAHTYALYWGMPEQYQTNPPNGKTASGVWAQNGQWRTGYSFMGTAPYKTLNFTWVDNDSTYRYLFNHTAMNLNDPEILIANGLIYKNGTVEFLSDWYHLQQGTPDTLTPGDYALRFVDASGTPLAETSFDASFFMHIDPGISVGMDAIDVRAFGRVETDAAAFAFATAYPQGTSAVQVVDITDPQNQVVLATVNAADIKNYPYSFYGFFPPINNDGSSIFKLGSTVPVKFQLKDPQGDYFTTATAKIYIANISGNAIGTYMEAHSTSAATTGNLFRYDSTSNQYIFNLSTKSLSKGTWQIKVILDDGTQKTVIIRLK